MSFHLESLNFLPGLQRLDGTWMGPMWHNYAKLLVKIASYLHKGTLGIVENSSSFVLWTSSPWAFKRILWLVTIASFLRSIPLLMYHFKHGCFTIAQTSESLRIGHALNSLELWMKPVKFKYQTPRKHCKFELLTRAPVSKGP